jgi:hypothetical protein
MSSRIYTAVPLLKFSTGDRVFRYAESAVDIIADDTGTDRVFQGAAIKLGTLKSRTKISESDSFIVTLPRDLEIVDIIIKKELTTGINFVLNYVQVSLSGVVTALPISFKAKVVSFTLKDATIAVELEGVSQILQSIGLRRKYGTTCSHALYDGQCKAKVSDFSVNRSLTYSHGRTTIGGGYIVLGGTPLVDSLFDGGSAVMTLNNVEISVRIAHNDTTTIFVDYLPSNLPISPEVLPPVTLRQGCDLTFNTCVNKFSNEINFGGIPFFRNGVNVFQADGYAANLEETVPDITNDELTEYLTFNH